MLLCDLFLVLIVASVITKQYVHAQTGLDFSEALPKGCNDACIHHEHFL